MNIPTRLVFKALAAACLLFGLACVDPKGTSTSGTSLYVFDASDSASSRILVWDDLETLEAEPATSPTRSLKSSLLDDVQALGWGGMTVDASAGRLWLVSETGRVLRIDSVRSLSGTVAGTYIRSFQLGSGDSDLLSSGTFGQMSVDPSTGSLYVTESNNSTGRIWVVANPTQYAEGGTVSPPVVLRVSGDTGATGVSVGAPGEIYGYFQGGSTITSDSTTYSGARLRKGLSTGFSSTASALIGSSTQLAKYGCLAADVSNDRIFVCRNNTDSGKTSAPIQVFSTAQFATGFNQAPELSLGSTSSQASLRIIAHPRTKDWLVGAESADSGTLGSYRLWIWKSPGDAPIAVNVDLDATVQVRGLALDVND